MATEDFSSHAKIKWQTLPSLGCVDKKDAVGPNRASAHTSIWAQRSLGSAIVHYVLKSLVKPHEHWHCYWNRQLRFVRMHLERNYFLANFSAFFFYGDLLKPRSILRQIVSLTPWKHDRYESSISETEPRHELKRFESEFDKHYAAQVGSLPCEHGWLLVWLSCRSCDARVIKHWLNVRLNPRTGNTSQVKIIISTTFRYSQLPWWSDAEILARKVVNDCSPKHCKQARNEEIKNQQPGQIGVDTTCMKKTILHPVNGNLYDRMREHLIKEPQS